LIESLSIKISSLNFERLKGQEGGLAPALLRSTPQLLLQRLESCNDIFLLRVPSIFDNSLTTNHHVPDCSF
jgi:hypothetical protein